MSRPRLLVCVLGGTGFVGTELVARLAHLGHRVRVLTRSAYRAQHLTVLAPVEVVEADPHDPAMLAQQFAGTDVVVNLIGILNERGRSGAGFRVAHTDLARKVVAAARSRRVRGLLHMSALGADATGPSHYLRTKGEAEQHVRAAAPDVEFTIFRPSVIFGSRDSLTNRFARLLRLTGGILPLAKPRARLSPVWVGDVAEAFVRALHGGPTSGQTYELCGPEVYTLEDLVRATARIARLPCRLLPLPDALARAQAFVMDFVPGKPFSTDNLRSLSVDGLCHDHGCARLGIRAQALGAVVPGYLGPEGRSARLDQYRRSG